MKPDRTAAERQRRRRARLAVSEHVYMVRLPFDVVLAMLASNDIDADDPADREAIGEEIAEFFRRRHA